MAANTIQPFVSSVSSQRAKSLESKESAVETKSDNDQDDVKVPAEMVKLSDTSVKLSSFSTVKSSDRPTSITNKDQAKQSLKQLVSDMQSNPAQASAAQGNIFSGAVRSLLG